MVKKPISPALLCAAALALCIAQAAVAESSKTKVVFPAPRPPSNDIVMENMVPITMRDGAVLYADVYRPAQEGQYPVLVSRTPYSTERPGAFRPGVFYAQRGYAFVYQDARGRHESEGEWDPFQAEFEDGYDTVEWAAKQPWSNGKVGMQGGSYLGIVQWQAAKTAPPHLVTIFPSVAATSLYHDGFTVNGGFRLALSFGWGPMRMDSRIMQNLEPNLIEGGPEGISLDKAMWHLPLVEMPKVLGHNAGYYTRWLEHPDYDEQWQALSVQEHFERIAVPVHTFGGWFDIFIQGTINGFAGMRKQGKNAEARQGTRVLIGPWGHGPSQKIGDLDFGPDAMVDPFSIELRWYDYWLKGIDTGIRNEPPVTLFVMGKNQWRYENEYPLARTQYKPLYFHSGGNANSYRGDGRLSWDAPAGPSQPDRYRYDPANPVPSVGGNNCCGVPTPIGPVNQRPVEQRNDVLVYTSDFLQEELEITGPVKVVLYASSDAVDTDFIAKLVDVYPDGKAYNIAEGILRTRYRESKSNPQVLEPGKTYKMEIDLIGTSNVFLPGHRIRVNVTSSHFPQFNRNLNTGEPFGTGTTMKIAEQTIRHSADAPTHVVLPVIPAE